MANEFPSLITAPDDVTREVARVARIVNIALANLAFHTYADSLVSVVDGQTVRVVLQIDESHGVEIVIRDLVLDTDRPICYTEVVPNS